MKSTHAYTHVNKCACVCVCVGTRVSVKSPK